VSIDRDPVLTRNGFAYLPFETVLADTIDRRWHGIIQEPRRADRPWLWVIERHVTEQVFGEFPALPAFLSSVRRRGHAIIVEWSEPSPHCPHCDPGRVILRVIVLMGYGPKEKTVHRVAIRC